MSPIALYLVFSMLAVGVSDTARYRIPNWLVASLLLLYPLAVYLHPQAIDWQHALLAMAVTFAGGYAIYALRLMGAGDIKLLAACALWVGWEHLLEFIFTVALLGGFLALGLWLLRKPLPLLLPNVTLPRILKEGEPVAYGLAIAAAFLLMMQQHYIAAL